MISPLPAPNPAPDQAADYQIGDLVRCAVHHYQGHVTGLFRSYWAMHEGITGEGLSWLEDQEVAFSSGQINQQTWYRVACLDGGELQSCHSRLELVRPTTTTSAP